MMAIKIVTDSTAYLPADFVARHDIRVVPLSVVFGERAYREGIDISNEEFYRLLAASPKLPSTSQPPPGDFQAIYADLVAAGHEVISIHLSGRLSGAVEAARIAAQMVPEGRVHVVDSRSTSIGLAMMVIRAAEAVAQGRDLSHILPHLEQMIRDLNVVLVLDTLEYVEKGGRIGAARALLGTLLKIKPILKLEEGQVVPFTTVRTRRKAIAFMFDHLAEVAHGRPVYAAVTHAQVPDEMEELQRMMRERLNCVDLFTVESGPVIGTHGGPGLLGAVTCPAESAP
jgi:DegV family protein with EDD domain